MPLLAFKEEEGEDVGKPFPWHFSIARDLDLHGLCFGEVASQNDMEEQHPRHDLFTRTPDTYATLSSDCNTVLI